jgi:hypothetical protein
MARQGAGLRAQQKGERGRAVHAFTFVSARPVGQPVGPLDFFKGAALEVEHLQLEFPLLARMEGPAIVPPELLRKARTYREAVRLCWALRRLRRMTFTHLAAEAGLIPQHVGDYLNPDDGKHRRDLPGDKVEAVEAILGNTAISQWHAQRARFTVLEVMQAAGRAAA